MSEVICSCCGRSDLSIAYENMTSVYSTNPWKVARCNNCSNMITLPVPDEKSLHDIYSNTYLYPIHQLILGEKKLRAVGLAKFINKINSGTGSKKIFEAGCMFGYLLEELKNNHSVKGIEIGDDAVGYCNSKGLDVINISMENYLMNYEEKFDYIILSHVFEHLLACDKILSQLADRLNAGGRIILCVPNSDSISRRLFGRYWGWWQVPVHINHFSKHSLHVLAGRCELQLEKSRFMGGDSLMLLLNLINLFGFRKNKPPGIFQKIVIRIFTSIFCYWYYIGNEELTVVLSRRN
jgi:SAM-dependent methyltransferase